MTVLGRHSMLVTLVVAATSVMIGLSAAVAETSFRAAHAPWQAQVMPDTIAGDASRTRLFVGLDRAVQPLVTTFAQRVVIDLPEVKMQLPPPTNGTVGLVQGFTGGLAGAGRSRIIIDVTQPVAADARVERTADGRGHHLVVDMVPADAKAEPKSTRDQLPKAAGLGAAGVEPPKPRPVLNKQAQSSRTKWTVVIDPGHGGHDSGAMKHGTVEKEVVLAFALMLRDKLTATGRYNVLMTRDSDVFVPLDERRQFAEKNDAQLFIAVHADYASTQARGATIYTLRDGMFNSLKRSAKTQVADVALPDTIKSVHQQVGTDSKEIAAWLGELAQKEVEANDQATSLFRTQAIQEMDAATTLRDNPEQSANFRVLLTAKVPSVLIELAYVSNQQDAKLLKSDEWRHKVSDSIAKAVENYFAAQRERLPMSAAAAQ